MTISHPLVALSIDEVSLVRDLVVAGNPNAAIEFRQIGLKEPPKEELLPYLELEHSGKLTSSTPLPTRLADCQYDTITKADGVLYNEDVIDIDAGKIIKHVVVPKEFSPCLTISEFDTLVQVCEASPLFHEAIAELDLPDHLEVIVEPWPYGSLEDTDEPGRYFQGLIFARDKRNGDNPDANYYPFPIPLIPVMDYYKKELVRIDRVATGGTGDPMVRPADQSYKNTIKHCKPADYVPELLPNGTRKDLKELSVIQPDGPSFKVTDDSLIEWQKWRFRVSMTPREGVVIHDVYYDNRSLFYRLSISEMTVPYGDPRPPYHRKQAFDFGEGGASMNCNNLALGCDCLGHIKYFDSYLLTPSGDVKPAPNVICLHEQDSGIGWKHTNWRTHRAVVTRNRELVVQFILTLANYEYVFAYKFNQSAGIDVEVRATGIVSVVNIDAGKTSEYGNVVNPGVLAQNHQHVFAVRIDPAVDGRRNTVVQEESLPVPMNAKTNPMGNFYRVVQTPITQSSWADANISTNRVFKIVNPSVKNPVSGKPVGYKLVPPPTQMMLADPRSLQARRAAFGQHHVWVTKYQEGELWAAGPYPFQSTREQGGVQDMVARGDSVEDEDVVVWSCFCLTHNPRVEDWPVMPVEIHQVQLRPADFFTYNPSLDVPASNNKASKEVPRANGLNGTNGTNGAVHANGCH